MGRKVPFPQSKEEAGVLRSELAVRAYARVPAARFTGGGRLGTNLYRLILHIIWKYCQKRKIFLNGFFISMNVQIRNNLKKISILTYFAIYLSYLHNALPARATIPYIFRI